jgi:phage baseplate assembly protein W
MATHTLYKGLSSQRWMNTNGKTLRISDIEAVKQDLMNHIFTAVGDRVTMPDWGTRIPLMVFEINDEFTRKIIYDDIKLCIDYDPRLKLISIQLISLPDNNAVVAYCDVLFVEFAVTKTLHIEVPVGGIG